MWCYVCDSSFGATTGKQMKAHDLEHCAKGQHCTWQDPACAFDPGPDRDHEKPYRCCTCNKLIRKPNDISIKKTGIPSRPWEARCRVHPPGPREEIYFPGGVGAVAFNTRGMGNRLWVLAMMAAHSHLLKFHEVKGDGWG